MAGFDFTDVHKGEAADTERYLLSFVPYAVREADKTQQPNYGFALAEIFSRLTPDDFGDPTNKWVFAAAQDLFLHRQHIDAAAVAIHAGVMGHITQATATKAILQICDPNSDGTCTILGWKQAIAAVKRNSAMRQALFAMGDVYMDLTTGRAEDGTIQKLADRLIQIFIDNHAAEWSENNSKNQTVKQVELYERECNMTDEEVLENTFLFPFKGLNLMTNNAMSRGEFWVISAKSGVGKTVFAAQTAAFLAGLGRRVLYVTGEEKERDIIDRVVSNETGISYGRCSKKLGKNKFAPDDWSKIVSWADKMGKEYLTVRRTWEMDSIECFVKLALAHDELDVLVVDHIQLLDPISRTGKKFGTDQEIKDIVKTLHKWAQEYNILVIALSQGNRDKTAQTANGGLTLDSLYGSAAIGMFANGVLAINPNPDDPEGHTECAVLKCRRGRRGTVNLKFDGAHQRFVEDSANLMAQGRELTEKERKPLPFAVKAKIKEQRFQKSCNDLFNPDGKKE